MPPVPGASAPRGGRPVADLGKLFAGSDTQERPRVEELPVSLNDPRARTDASDARNLFIELGGNYMVPVRDFMFDVKSGEARVDWLRTCESSVQMLKGVADGLVMTKLAHALEKFAQVLKAAGTYQEQTIRGDTRDTLLAAYFNLIDLMPQAFGLDAERSRRETIIINSLLLQIPGVSRSAVDLMHAAGLDSLDTILAAVPGQIAATTGLPAETATKIIEKVLAHRKELETGSLAGLPPPPAPEGMGAPPMPGTRGHRTASPSTFDSVEAMTDGASIDLLVEEALHEGAPTGNAGAAGPTAKLLPASPDRDLLESLLKQLRTQTAELATVAEGWSDAAKTRRRGLRKARTDLLQQVKVVLLRLGETEGASEIDKLSLERKLERIERYLRV